MLQWIKHANNRTDGRFLHAAWRWEHSRKYKHPAESAPSAISKIYWSFFLNFPWWDRSLFQEDLKFTFELLSKSLKNPLLNEDDWAKLKVIWGAEFKLTFSFSLVFYLWLDCDQVNGWMQSRTGSCWNLLWNSNKPVKAETNICFLTQEIFKWKLSRVFLSKWKTDVDRGNNCVFSWPRPVAAAAGQCEARSPPLLMNVCCRIRPGLLILGEQPARRVPQWHPDNQSEGWWEINASTDSMTSGGAQGLFEMRHVWELDTCVFCFCPLGIKWRGQDREKAGTTFLHHDLIYVSY